jgi:hypothetical protein
MHIVNNSHIFLEMFQKYLFGGFCHQEEPQKHTETFTASQTQVRQALPECIPVKCSNPGQLLQGGACVFDRHPFSPCKVHTVHIWQGGACGCRYPSL